MAKIDADAMNQIMAEQEATERERAKARVTLLEAALSKFTVSGQWMGSGGVWVDSTKVVAVGMHDGQTWVFVDGVADAFLAPEDTTPEQVLMVVNSARLSARRYP